MQKRQLGNSDLLITPIGLGAWAMGGGGWEYGWGSQEDRDSITAIHEGLDQGVPHHAALGEYIRTVVAATMHRHLAIIQ
jgi:aryl-alcohol dehydrogenase-like predicted oxidoreductase